MEKLQSVSVTYNQQVELGTLHLSLVFRRSDWFQRFLARNRAFLLILTWYIPDAMAEENLLFQDIFDIKDIDPNGKRFDRGKI